MPHPQEQCLVAQKILEEENQGYEERPMINALSSTPFWSGDSDDSNGEYMPDESYKRLGYQQEQQVFSDNDESPDVRRKIKEEREAYTMAAMEQVLSNYRLRNRM